MGAEGNFYGFPALPKSDRTAIIPGAAVSRAYAEVETNAKAVQEVGETPAISERDNRI